MDWPHKWEVLTFTERFVLKECKKSFSESKSTRRRHPMFEHLHKVPFWHHCLIITSCKELLLHLESSTLIERIIELRETISNFTSCDNRLKSFHSSWKLIRSLCKRRDNLWMINEKCWSCNLFSNIFPECIRETFPIVSFIFYIQFFEFISHLFISCCEEIDPSFRLYCFEVVDFWPFSSKIELMSFCCKGSFSIDF